jgi:dihydrofolate synthase/folylpolyglutamate synthase
MLDAPLGGEVVAAAMCDLSVPGRLEVVAERPLVVLDGAHNPDAVRSLVASVPEVFPAGRRILVVGALGPRDPGALFDELAHLAPDLVLVCTAPSPRAVPADELARSCAERGLDVEAVPDVAEAVRRAVALAGEDDLVLVTGSFYVLSGARPAAAP